ncbi:MAG: 3'(2'),5'-bisphosphate nucleotidase CysQ [Burkholderiales bacterium]|nr:3'(2'),5'-bisphosphate nucleotidase CysQ [Burkholderiales bacterium]
MPKLPSHADLIEPLIDLARAAGVAIMQVYATDFDVAAKADASPVTAADEAAERIILAGLARLDPATPVVAEEEVAAGRVPVVAERFWLVDPLDGTREFVGRNGEFTVNIALIERGAPLLGVVFVPERERLFAGVVGIGAFEIAAAGRRAIQCRAVPAAGLSVLASRSHGDGPALDRWLQDKRVAEVRSAGSSMKLCLIAAGEADAYPRLGRTMEWDIAAGHAVLAAAGGSVRRLDDGAALRYGKPGFENPHFVASGLG